MYIERERERPLSPAQWLKTAFIQTEGFMFLNCLHRWHRMAAAAACTTCPAAVQPPASPEIHSEKGLMITTTKKKRAIRKIFDAQTQWTESKLLLDWYCSFFVPLCGFNPFNRCAYRRVWGKGALKGEKVAASSVRLSLFFLNFTMIKESQSNVVVELKYFASLSIFNPLVGSRTPTCPK
jgi:hypothetical protein